MIKIKEINVIGNLGLEFLLVKLIMEDTEESLSDYTFNIYRSSSPEDGFEIIASDIQEPYEFLDTSVNLYKNNIRFYYKVEIINKISLISSMPDIYGEIYQRKPDEVSGFIIHNNKILLNVIDNDPIWILQKKRHGQKCTNCWDDIRRQVTMNNCPVCLESGYVGGYYKPIQVNMSYSSSPSSRQSEVAIEEIYSSIEPISIWIANYPIVEAGDIVVDVYNNRYIIMRVVNTTKNKYHLLRQVITMQKIPRGNVAFQIPMD